MNPKVILYPTDTVYGLGVDATDPEAIRALRELKGSGGEKHYPIIVSDLEMAKQYAEFTPLALRLAARFWPGKLTLVLRPKNLPKELGDGSDEIGIRIPNHSVPLALIRELGKPITTTSANVSGMKPENSIKKILEQFGPKATMIYHSKDCPESLPPSEPSTVVDARGARPVILREGAIPTLAINEVVM